MAEAASGLLRDLLDADPVPQDRVNEYGVVINLPTIIVNADEHDGLPDEARQNLRVIPYERLAELMRVGMEITDADTDRQMRIFEDLFASLVNTYDKENDASQHGNGENPLESVLGLLGVVTSIANDIDIDDTHADLTSCCLSFDMIRRYVNHPTTRLLVSAELEPYDRYVSYSQIDDEQLRNAIRRERNDTDINRFHYALGYFENTLRFVPDFLCDRTVKLVNLALLHVWLASASRPIAGLSSNTVKANILAYAFDVIVRSRLLQAWRNNPTTRALLSDIARNYNANQIMVQLCRLPDAKSRAKLLLREVSRQEPTRLFAEVLSYEMYERLLETTRETIGGRSYYLLDHRFVFDIMTSQNFDAIRQYLNPQRIAAAERGLSEATAAAATTTTRATTPNDRDNDVEMETVASSDEAERSSQVGSTNGWRNDDDDDDDGARRIENAAMTVYEDQRTTATVTVADSAETHNNPQRRQQNRNLPAGPLTYRKKQRVL